MQPIHTVFQILDDLRARLDLSPSVRHGIVVFRVVRHSPADAAGVLPGDIVTHINGTEVKCTVIIGYFVIFVETVSKVYWLFTALYDSQNPFTNYRVTILVGNKVGLGSSPSWWLPMQYGETSQI